MGVSENWGIPYFGVLKIRILLFRVLDLGPLFSETPTCMGGAMKVGRPSVLCKRVATVVTYNNEAMRGRVLCLRRLLQVRCLTSKVEFLVTSFGPPTIRRCPTFSPVQNRFPPPPPSSVECAITLAVCSEVWKHYCTYFRPSGGQPRMLSKPDEAP